MNSPIGKAIPENFHPVLKLSNFEPDWLSFTYNGGTDLHLQVKLWKIWKSKEGGVFGLDYTQCASLKHIQ